MSKVAHANVVARLQQMRALWEQAARDYFKPAAFQLALQNCVTTSRTVTFILQNNKHDIDGFDEWYEGYQESWRADPIMRWAVDARNKIEKQGDLEMHSQVRAKIIASYIGAAETNWLPQALFTSPQQMLRLIPRRFHIPQIIEHGSLLIERRWVHTALPDHEVLAALAHVHSALADLVNALADKEGIDAPPVECAPLSMKPLLMDRALYLAIKDGAELGLRLFPRTVTTEEVGRVARKYQKTTDWSAAPKVKTFRELADFMFANARGMMLHDHYHSSLALLFKGVKLDRVIGMDHPTRASRYVIVREMALLAQTVGADGVLLIAEAWTAKREDTPPSGYAVEAKKRGEALIMSAANAQGETYQYEAQVERKLVKKTKVKRIGPTQVTPEFAFIIAPFQQAWGCLNMEEVLRHEERMSEFGIAPLYDQLRED